jgi:hypothetical protein
MNHLRKNLRAICITETLFAEEFELSLNHELDRLGRSVIDIKFDITAATETPVIWSALIIYEEEDVN